MNKKTQVAKQVGTSIQKEAKSLGKGTDKQIDSHILLYQKNSHTVSP